MICAYIYMYVHMYVQGCIHIYIYIYIYMSAICVCAHVNITVFTQYTYQTLLANPVVCNVCNLNSCRLLCRYPHLI